MLHLSEQRGSIQCTESQMLHCHTSEHLVALCLILFGVEDFTLSFYLHLVKSLVLQAWGDSLEVFYEVHLDTNAVWPSVFVFLNQTPLLADERDVLTVFGGDEGEAVGNQHFRQLVE